MKGGNGHIKRWTHSLSDIRTTLFSAFLLIFENLQTIFFATETLKLSFCLSPKKMNNDRLLGSLRIYSTTWAGFSKNPEKTFSAGKQIFVTPQTSEQLFTSTKTNTEKGKGHQMNSAHYEVRHHVSVGDTCYVSLCSKLQWTAMTYSVPHSDRSCALGEVQKRKKEKEILSERVKECLTKHWRLSWPSKSRLGTAPMAWTMGCDSRRWRTAPTGKG